MFGFSGSGATEAWPLWKRAVAGSNPVSPIDPRGESSNSWSSWLACPDNLANRFRAVAQLEECLAVDQKVAGASPVGPVRGSSMVERRSVKAMVVGSSPTFGVQPSNGVTGNAPLCDGGVSGSKPDSRIRSLGQIAKPPVLDTGVSECESRREH